MSRWDDIGVDVLLDMGYTVDFAGAKRDLERHLVEHRNLLAIARGE